MANLMKNIDPKTGFLATLSKLLKGNVAGDSELPVGADESVGVKSNIDPAEVDSPKETSNYPDFDTTIPEDKSGPQNVTDSVNPVTAPVPKPSKLQRGLGLIAGLAAGYGVAGRNRTGLEAVNTAAQLSEEAKLNKARVGQIGAQTEGTQAQTAEQKLETGRKAGVYAKQPPITREQEIEYGHQAQPITDEADASGKKYKVDAQGHAVPVVVQGALGADGKTTATPQQVTGAPAKVDPATAAINAYVAQHGKMPEGDDMAQIIKDTSPRFITGVEQNASRERMNTATNATRVYAVQQATTRAMGAAQIHWNAATTMFNNGQLTKYDLENSRGDISLMKQIAANIGKDYAQNPKMRALGIVDDSSAEDALNALQNRLDARLQHGQARTGQGSGAGNGTQKYTATSDGSNPQFPKGTKMGSNDGKTWFKIRQ